MELFLSVQQASPCPCPELEPLVWAPSDQPGKTFCPWEVGRAENQVSRRAERGMGLSQLWLSQDGAHQESSGWQVWLNTKELQRRQA